MTVKQDPKEQQHAETVGESIGKRTVLGQPRTTEPSIQKELATPSIPPPKNEKTETKPDGLEGALSTEPLSISHVEAPASLVSVADTLVEKDPLIGTVLSERYSIRSVLGRGGMGVVYAASHVIIEKRVAVKVLSQDFAHKEELVQRFMHEAKAASRIGHENIVDIHDFGTTPQGSAFFVMEYLDGRDLGTIIDQDGPLPWERCKPIILQICKALGAAHAKGIIHRDLKPDNIFLIDRDGNENFVKVLDFGIAKMTGIDEGDRRLTKTGMIFGTPDYMSPEQASGKRPDHRVDIYALGVITYEMLTGSLPFQAESFMGILTKHMFEQALLPSQARPDLDIPEAADRIVAKAMAKEREERFQSMGELASAITGEETDWDMSPSKLLSIQRQDDVVLLTRRRDSMSESSPSLVPSTTAPSGELTDPSFKTREPRPGRRRTRLFAAMILVALVAGGTVALGIVYRDRFFPSSSSKAGKGQPAASTNSNTLPRKVVVEPMTVEPPIARKTVPADAGIRPLPKFVELNLSTEPAGADVYLKEKKLGQTPLSGHPLRYATTGITLLLRMKGYKDREIMVLPSKDVNLQSIKLTPDESSISRWSHRRPHDRRAGRRQREDGRPRQMQPPGLKTPDWSRDPSRSR